MQSRQDGVALSVALEVVGADQGMRQFVMAAWEVPMHDTEQQHRRAVQEFRNEIEKLCYQERS